MKREKNMEIIMDSITLEESYYESYKLNPVCDKIIESITKHHKNMVDELLEPLTELQKVIVMGELNVGCPQEIKPNVFHELRDIMDRQVQTFVYSSTDINKNLYLIRFLNDLKMFFSSMIIRDTLWTESEMDKIEKIVKRIK